MSLFSRKKLATSQSLQIQTATILDVFNNTVDGLRSVNEQAKEEADRQVIIMKAAEEEKSKLDNIIAANDKVITNINNFFTT